MNASQIVGVEWATLEGRRPRPAGCNARLDAHGDLIRLPAVRLTTADGATGFGVCRAMPEQVAQIVGASLETLFSLEAGVNEAWLAFDYPLWDLVGQRTGRPVYELAGEIVGRTPPTPLRAPCYDSSFYFDDLHLASTQAAAEWMAEEARAVYVRGHRVFKIKIGRGARHLPLMEGTARDVAIIHAVREAVGPQATLLIDANNGYNLNLAKQVLQETAGCHIFWLEEPFHEDPVLYQDLKAWLAGRGLATLIADGEGDASPQLLAWAREGLINVVQYDVIGYGFTPWLHLGRQLDAWGVRSAPHHFGTHYGNYAACHLAAAFRHFTFVEWDEAQTPGLDAAGYVLEEGFVQVPDTPGFGLALDDGVFQRAVKAGGGVCWL
ncbi:MAG: mandelate racemase [Chloroflexi bacterium]|nr:mandelate racemase [Chloroflexota bacterium]MCI0579506.1 mandelate racemase [Chloroflexota bacterium]MCI0647282.1 mandelate racemase [Chloroflexota bacterium]MCI0729321.1 mandelate racemase [Chloroflexota bacterium]